MTDYPIHPWDEPFHIPETSDVDENSTPLLEGTQPSTESHEMITPRIRRKPLPSQSSITLLPSQLPHQAEVSQDPAAACLQTSEDNSVGADITTDGSREQEDVRGPVSHSTKHEFDRPILQTRWHPVTLRWPFICSLTIFSIALVVIVINLQSESLAHQGLADNDGRSILFFGWRFTPTLVAVCYTLMHTILLEDIKRTEPYARLAKPMGGIAAATVLQEPGAWWNALIDGFSREKNNGHRSWSLIFSSLGLILSLLIISPLSSTLLVPVEVDVISKTSFQGIQTQQGSSIVFGNQVVPRFRTISNLLQNVTTSAWITDRFTVLPFWPSDLASVPLDASLGSSAQVWQAQTTVYTCELDCKPLLLTSLDMMTMSTNYTDEHNNTTSYYGNETFTAGVINLATDDEACTQTFSMLNYSNFVNFGGFSWSVPGVFAGGEFPTGRDFDPIILNVSQHCSNDEMLLISTPWFTDSCNDTSADCNGTWSPDLKVVGQSCAAKYRAAEIPVTVNITSLAASVNFSQEDYATYSHPIDQNFIDTTRFEELFLSTNWTGHFVPVTNRSSTGGPGSPLAAIYNFSTSEATHDDNLVEQATRAKQRYFGEALIVSLSRNNSLNVATTSGTITTKRARIVVAQGIAFTLEAVLLIETILVCALFWSTRLRNRPLGLSFDPARSSSIAKLIAGGQTNAREHFIAESADSDQIKRNLTRVRFHTATGHLLVISGGGNHESLSKSVTSDVKRSRPRSSQQKLHDWQPATLRWWTIVGLLAILTATITAIAVLYKFSAGPGLYQKAFLFQTQIEISNIHLSTVAPYSIIPTALAVGIGIWWSAMESEFRWLQPFITMAQSPVSFADGIDLSYQSSYLLWATSRAMLRNHWLLALLCTGTFFSQICMTPLSPVSKFSDQALVTVAISALWQPEYGFRNYTTTLARNLELRTVPHVTYTTIPGGIIDDQLVRSRVLANLYGQLETNWLYSSIIQLSLRGSQPSWSLDGWSFVPVDLSGISPADSYQANTLVRLTTPAISAQIVCSPCEPLSNLSNWLLLQDFSNSSIYNTTLNPPGLDSGYVFLDQITLQPANDDRSTMVSTTFLSDMAKPQCCPNSTINSDGDAIIAYWSRTEYYGSEIAGDSSNLTVKWIYGQPSLGGQRLGDDGHAEMVWRDPPQIAALNCKPLMHIANASIVVEPQTGTVESFVLLDGPKRDDMALNVNFLGNDYLVNSGSSSYYKVSVAIDYASLFTAAMLHAADQVNLAGWGSDQDPVESLSDTTFNFKEPGLNLDFMSYSMLSLLNGSTTALLDFDTLAKYANQTFSTFFQHYASSNLSVTEGGWAYQKVGTTLKTQADPSLASNKSLPIEVEVTKRVQMLRMSPIAAWICMAILIWLLITTILILFVKKRYLGRLLQGVKTIADVAILLAASEALLTVLEGRLQGADERTKKKNADLKTKLGWFRDKQGHERYGIELAGDEHGVVWLDKSGTGHSNKLDRQSRKGYHPVTQASETNTEV